MPATTAVEAAKNSTCLSGRRNEISMPPGVSTTRKRRGTSTAGIKTQTQSFEAPAVRCLWRLPMSTTEAIVTIAVVALTAGIPLMGITLRLALKPVIEAYARIREAHGVADRTDLAMLRER